MITLDGDRLEFRFPEVHEDATLCISFQRTLRIPDDGRTYPLPPGLGNFPLRHLDDYAAKLPPDFGKRGGVLMPMFQAEAMWIRFKCESDYPFAIKIGAGKVNAVTGETVWRAHLNRNPQDYVVAPKQPWVDGYCVQKGLIRQFVAMPLGEGYSVEEQLTGDAKWGGIQLQVYPLKREHYRPAAMDNADIPAFLGRSSRVEFSLRSLSMGLGAGGRMKQDISRDDIGLDAWDQRHGARCFVSILNMDAWKEISGETPLHAAPTPKDYEKANLPWFDYYAEAPALGGGGFSAVQSVAEMKAAKGEAPLVDNESVDAGPYVVIRKKNWSRRPQGRPVREANEGV